MSEQRTVMRMSEDRDFVFIYYSFVKLGQLVFWQKLELDRITLTCTSSIYMLSLKTNETY